ncbi:MAG: BatD family protein [Planctomycetes bacterium]|nr:BatD family protein [Planctomycetota bacterium]
MSALLAGLLAFVIPQDPPPVFVEVEASATSAWVHEPVDVVVRIGTDDVWFGAHAVPLFQQPLDRPYHVTVPWLSAGEDRAVELVPAADGVARIAVGDGVVSARSAGRRDVGGRSFDVLELRYRWLPLVPGTSTIQPVELRYAFGERFTENFLSGRQPVGRAEANVLSAVRTLEVKALPLAGRPPGWTGAVGEFTVAASAAVTSVHVGESFALEVRVEGRGNLDRFAPMAWPPLPGFQVQGLVERRTAEARTFVFDVLALRAGAAAVPPVTFASFSPRRGDYIVQSTAPVPVTVQPANSALPARVQELVDADARSARRPVPWWWHASVIAVVLLVHGAFRSRRRQRRFAEAVRAAAAAVAAAPGEVQRTLTAFEDLCGLAARAPFAGEPTWSALALLVPPPVLASARRVHAALDAARFGGGPPAAEDVARAAADLADAVAGRA